jgi:hypothetical protein
MREDMYVQAASKLITTEMPNFISNVPLQTLYKP